MEFFIFFFHGCDFKIIIFGTVTANAVYVVQTKNELVNIKYLCACPKHDIWLNTVGIELNVLIV
jgi:hypothetical protein